MSDSPTIEGLLARWASGDRAALDHLMPILIDELRQIAAAHLRREREGHTLQPTAVVNEAYIRLSGHTHLQLCTRTHFLAIASRVMRQLLVDHARKRDAARRGGGQIVKTELPHIGAPAEDPVAILAFDQALSKLSQLNSRQAEVVELVCFAGLRLNEVADILDVCVRTVKRDWSVARLWLRRELGYPA
jgi:RNA polymerase sigma-70 factor, ECF subfamily